MFLWRIVKNIFFVLAVFILLVTLVIFFSTYVFSQLNKQLNTTLSFSLSAILLFIITSKLFRVNIADIFTFKKLQITLKFFLYSISFQTLIISLFHSTLIKQTIELFLNSDNIINQVSLPSFFSIFEQVSVDQTYYVIIGIIVFPIFEELLFRGIILTISHEKTNTILAILLSSLTFSFFHSFELFSFVTGLFFSLVFLYRRNLVDVIIAHITVNLTTTLIGLSPYYLSNSIIEMLFIYEKENNYYSFSPIILVISSALVILFIFDIINKGSLFQMLTPGYN